ncbi:DUF1552 domain-containing protein [Phenylobacterium sp. LjRoot225]|uniref:DUF1552 domain-containing protein n=1 Tax=Phenylobacterium sp. LjRoot225 TaxID=3342285 RepID=UPI003ED05047
MIRLSRRTMLRGVLNGAAVGVALPLLDVFLDGNGQALASGAPIPVRFGAWFWGLGVTEDRWKPTKIGAGYDLPFELKPIAPYSDKISILSGFDVPLDGKPNLPHNSGGIGIRTGVAPTSAALPAPSFDVLIADKIGGQTRFRSLEISATRDATNSLSGRGAGSLNPAESSPINFYNRLFGPEFVDPNKADFKPDPQIMARQSVLSAVADQRKDLEARLGARDRERLDQYFTALRQTEQQLSLQLEKPAPLAACRIPPRPADTTPPNNQIEYVIENHKTMAQLLAMALACNQTRVFNMNFNNGASSLTKAGSTISHHQLTHEEQIDPKLGYQPESTWFVERCMEAFGVFVDTLGQFKEGDGTLLDNTLVVAHSETNFAKTHSVEGVPMMLAGRAGGKIKTGLHVAGGGSPASRVGLTLQQVMGVPVDSWGEGGLHTSKPISEIMT